MIWSFEKCTGTHDVPKRRHDPGLGARTKGQRSLNNSGKLQDARKQKLISIGFIFDGAEAKRVREQTQRKPGSSWDRQADRKFQRTEQPHLRSTAAA